MKNSFFFLLAISWALLLGCNQRFPQISQVPEVSVVYPKNRLWTSPAGGKAVLFNSPSLQWPAQKESTYDIRMSPSRNFSEKKIEQTNIPFAIYHPHRLLDEGMWYWQYKVDKGNWSPVDSFLISSSTRAFIPPGVDRLIANIPREHPRVLVKKQDWEQFRQRAKAYEEAELIIREAEKYVGGKPPSEKAGEAGYNGKTEHQRKKIALNASRDLGNQVGMVLTSLIQAYTLTKDQRYFDTAKRWMLEIAGWDPKGVTRLNNFGDSNIMLAMALGADTFWELLSPAERKIIMDQAAARAQQFYLKWIGSTESRASSMHIWQHILHRMVQTSVALIDEVPEAATWMAYLYELWIAQSPKMGETDGAWFNGTGYVRMNTLTLLDVPAIFQEYTGIDFIQSDWYKHFPIWMNYAYPPGSTADGFGNDGTKYPMPDLEYAGFSDAFARVTGNPYAAWYAKKCLDNLGAALSEDDAFRWFRLQRGYKMKLPEPLETFDLPQAAVFPDVGLCYMNTDLEQAQNNLMLSIRSSPFGPLAHTHADHNTFNIAYGGKPLFYNSGYRPAMGDPHFLAWYKHTRGHNGILIDGHGQPFDGGAYGLIPRFLHGQQISYAVGDASNAYAASDLEKTDHGLKRFRRHYLMLRPSIIVVYDELEADHEAEWSWLLHHYEGLDVDIGNRTITGKNEMATGQVSLFASSPIDFQLTDQFSVEPENYARKVDGAGNLVKFVDQWHFTGVSKNRTKNMRFLAIIQVSPDESFERVVLGRKGNYTVGDWQIKASMNADQPASIQVYKTDGTASFISNGVLSGKGKSFRGKSIDSAKLLEMIDGHPLFQEREDQIPAAIIRSMSRGN